MRTSAAVLVSSLLISPGTMSAQIGSDLDIKGVASRVESRLEACPRREVVAAFERSRRKQVWQKEAWGPPAQVFADAKANDSILYPYLLTVEFYLSFEYGPERKTKTQAEADTDFHRLPIPIPSAWGAKYRNVYIVSKDAIRLKTTSVLDSKPDGASTWAERPPLEDACWDQIR